MNEPLLSRAFSRGSRQSSAQPNEADPLAELARIVGEDDPFRDIFGEAQRHAQQPASSVRPSQAQQQPYEVPDYDPQAYSGQGYGAQDGYGYEAGQEAYDPAYYEGQPGYAQAAQDEYYDEESELGPDISLKKRRSGLMIAGVITVAVLGGAAYAMFRGDGGPVAGGNPPVIHADTAPTKTVPEKTADAPQHSKLIYDRVGAADKPGDEKVVSRTEEPMDLPAADVPPADAAASAGAANPAAPDAPASDGSASGEPRKVRTVLIRPDGTASDSDAPAAAPPPPAALAAPVAPPPAQPAPLPQVAAAAPGAGQPTSYPFSIIENDDLARPGAPPPATAEAPSAPAPAPRPAAPPKPAARPAPVAAPARPAPQQNQRVASLPSQQAPASAPVASSPSVKVPAGTYTVQLTSQRSEQDARAAYAALQKRFPSLLASRQPVVQKADLGSRGIYYRVKVVGGSRDAAVELCSGLKAQGGDCIVGN